MRAWYYNKFGNASVVKFGEMPEPTMVDSYDVVVKVYAASLNPIDNKRREGVFKLLLDQTWPTVMGYDVSGVVVSVGSSVTKFKVGDAVYALLPTMRMGALAERVSAPESVFAKKPANLSHVEAASLAMASLTALLAFRSGNLATGKKVIITGGAGGVGTAAIQIAKHMFKATEIATTASAKKADKVKALGATVVVDYNNEKMEEKLKDYDFALDGTIESARLFQVVRPKGTVVSLVEIPVPELMANREDEGISNGWFTHLILRMLSYSVRHKAIKADINYKTYFVAPDGDALDEIRVLCEEEKMVAVIDKVYAFEKADEALAYLDTGRATGKVVVEVVKEE